jgi:hypothetical protein
MEKEVPPLAIPILNPACILAPTDTPNELLDEEESDSVVDKDFVKL